MSRKRLHGCSVCGNDVYKSITSYILEVGGIQFLVKDVEIGKCIECGEQYHPAQTYLRIDSEIQSLLNKKVITKEDVKDFKLIDIKDIISMKPFITNNWMNDMKIKIDTLEKDVQMLKELNQVG